MVGAFDDLIPKGSAAPANQSAFSDLIPKSAGAGKNAFSDLIPGGAPEPKKWGMPKPKPQGPSLIDKAISGIKDYGGKAMDVYRGHYQGLKSSLGDIGAAGQAQDAEGAMRGILGGIGESAMFFTSPIEGAARYGTNMLPGNNQALKNKTAGDITNLATMFAGVKGARLPEGAPIPPRGNPLIQSPPKRLMLPAPTPKPEAPQINVPPNPIAGALPPPSLANRPPQQKLLPRPEDTGAFVTDVVGGTRRATPTEDIKNAPTDILKVSSSGETKPMTMSEAATSDAERNRMRDLGLLYSKAAPEELKQAAKVAASNEITPDKFSDMLFTLENKKKANEIGLRKQMETIKQSGLNSQAGERIYLHEENPEANPLTTTEKKIYDTVFRPMAQESDKIKQELGASGLISADEKASYTPRQAKGVGSSIDRMRASEGRMSTRGFSKKADTLKPRSYFVAETEGGARKTVFMDEDGKVYLATKNKGEKPKYLGYVDKDAKNVGVGSDILGRKNKLTLKQALTNEIERDTSTQYYKNIFGTRPVTYLQLKNAKENADFLKGILKNPAANNFVRRFTGKGDIPKGWRTVDIPTFQGYYFDPRYAEVLEDSIKSANTPDELLKGFDKVIRAARSSIFTSPIPHLRNIVNHYFVSKGLLGTARDAASGKTFRALRDSYKSVMNLDKDYIDYLNSGASLPGSDLMARQLRTDIIAAMESDFKKNPESFRELAKTFGYKTPAEMVKRFYRKVADVLWTGNDIVAMTRIKELEASGMSRAEAIKEAEKGIPNYRIPGRVMGSRIISKGLQSPYVDLFGRYQYGRMKAYAETVKDLASKESNPKLRAQALDQLAMMGFLFTVYYPLWDKAWQAVSGNKDAKATRPGAMAPIQAIADVATGDKTPSQAQNSVFSPGMAAAPAEMWFNTTLGLPGLQKYQPQDVTDIMSPDSSMSDRLRGGARVGYDLGTTAGSMFDPIRQAMMMANDKTDIGQYMGRQILGANFPTDEQVSNREKAKTYRKKDQQNATKRRPSFVP